MATTTTNFGWDIPQSTDLVKDGATAIAALGQDIDTAFVDLKGGTTGQVLAKASNTDLDYSWVAQDDSNAIQNTIVDAKGDLIAASASDTPARLAVGTNDALLIAASGESTGLKWGGLWQTFTPVFTNLTVGNATVIARYAKVGKNVNVYVSVTLGSTSSVAASEVYMDLPVTSNNVSFLGQLYVLDAGTALYTGVVIVNSSNCNLYPTNVSGTYATTSPITTTSPFTWTTNDKFVASFSYEAV